MLLPDHRVVTRARVESSTAGFPQTASVYRSVDMKGPRA